MKLRLPHKFQAALIAALASVSFTTLSTGAAYAEETPLTFGANLGDVMYVGDSITHGIAAASWRWSMHKIFVDAGVSYDENGYNTGNDPGYSGRLEPGTPYGGVVFENVHSAHSGGDAFEVIGRAKRGSSGHYGNSNIYNWLGVDTDMTVRGTGAGTYTGTVTDHVDTFLMLIGTNDLLSAHTDKPTEIAGSASNDLVTDIGKIYGVMQQSNPGSQLVLLSIPCWTDHGNNNSKEVHEAVVTANNKLKDWADSQANVTYADVNDGLIDVSSDVPFKGPRAFFRSPTGDGLHPNAQGEIIIAGNVAKAMGYAGRSVGLERSSATQPGSVTWTSAETPITVGTEAYVAEGAQFTTALGYTVDFSAVYGNGGTDEIWNNTDAFSITVGDGIHSGTLSLTEAYVKWGDKILYSRDNSESGNFRIAYINSSINTEDNVTAGYYVWLGDKLIGEGLAASGTASGISMQAAGEGATVSTLSWTDAAYAPTTTGYVNEAAAFHLVQVNPMPSHDADPAHIKDFNYETARKETSDTIGNGFFGAVKDNSATADTQVVYTLERQTGANAFGAVNASSNANIAAVFGGGGTVVSGNYSAAESAAFMGAYSGSIAGKLSVEMNDITFAGNVILGLVTNGATRTVGSTELIVNAGARIQGNVYGGHGVKAQGTITGGTRIEVTGGTITGSIYGGNEAGSGGSVAGGSEILISGGVISGGVFGGTAGGAFSGATSVTVVGNLASIGGNISADTVTLKDVAPNAGHYTDGFDSYRGTIRADKVVLHHYTVEQMLASLETQSLVLSGGTATTIRDLTLTACEITAEDTSAVTLDGTLTLGNTATYSGNVTLTNGMTINMVGGENTSASGAAQGGYRGGSWEVMKLAEGETAPSLTVNPETLVGAGMLQGSEFSYNSTTGLLSAEGTDYSTYYLEGDTTTLYLTAEQAEHPELQYVVVNVSGSVSLGDTRSLQAVYQDTDTVLTLTGSGELTVGSFGFGYGGYTYANISIDDGTTLKTGDLNVGEGKTFTTGGEGSYIGGTLTVIDAGTTVNLGSHAELSSLSMYSGNVNISGETTVSGTTDLSNGGGETGSTGVVTVKETGTLNINGSLWGRNASHLYMERGGTVNIGSNLSLVGAAADAELVAGGDNVQYSLGSNSWTIKNADATITSDENITIANLFSGNGSLVKLGAGTLTLTAANTFTGDLLISGGTVKVGNNSALGASGASHRIEVAANGTLDVNGSQGTGTEYTIVMNGGTLTNTGTAMGTNLRQVANHLVLEADSKVKPQNNFGLIAQGHNATSIEMGGHTLTIDGPSTFYVINATITGGGAIDVHSGTLNFNGGGSGRGTFASNFVLSGGTLSGNDLTLANDVYIETQANSNMSLSVKRQGHAITFKGDANLTETGNLSGVGAIVKEGTGALTLSGTTDVTGTIQLNGGSLNLGGTVAVNPASLGEFEVFDDSSQTYSHGNNGFLTSSGQYYLVKGGENTTASHTGAITGGSYVDSPTKDKGAGDIIITIDAAGSTTYYVNETMATADDTDITSTATTDIAIKKGATLTASSSSVTFNNAKLHGEGTYALADTVKAMSSGLSLDTDWAGIVRLTGASQNGIDFAQFANGTVSTIELKGFSGYASGTVWKGVNAQNFMLTNADSGGAAWTNGAFSTGSADTASYTGKWSGTGTYVTNIANDRYLNHTYSGDISDWAGIFDKQGAGTSILTFTGAADKVNVEIKQTGGTLNVVADANAAFSKAITATTLAVTAGKTATLGANATLGGLTGAGNIAVSTSNVTITLNGGSGSAYEFGGAITGAHLLNKTGAGTQTINGPVTVDRFTIGGGTTTFNGLVTGTAAGYTGNDRRMSVSGGTVYFNDGFAYTGGETYALVTSGNSTVHFGGISDLSGKNIGPGVSTAKIVLDANAILKVNEFFNSSTSTGSNGTLDMKSGSELTLAGKMYLTGATSEGGTIRMGNNASVNLHAASYQPDVTVFGLGAVVLDSANATIQTLNYGGTVVLDSIAGNGTLTLRAGANSTVRNTFSIGGSATKTKFSGTLAFERAAGGNRVLLAEFNDMYSAAGAVVQASLSGNHNNEAVGILINSDVVQMKGLKDGSNITNANSYALASGSASRLGNTNGDSNQYLDNASDGTSRTLEFTGSAASDSYTTAIKVLSGVNLKMSGAGSQTFNSDLSAMNGTVTVNSGTLTLSNSSATAASLGTIAVTGGELVLGGNITYTGSAPIANADTITLNSDLTATNLAVATNQDVYADLNGNLYADDSVGNYFAGTGADVITLATGSGSVVANGHRLTKDSVAYDIYANGLAAHFGEGGVNYTTFYQNEGELNFSDIAKESAKHEGAQPSLVYTTDATLNVDANPVSIMLKNGTANFSDGVKITGGLYIEGEDVYGGEYSIVTGQVDIERVWFAQNGQSATLFDNSVIEKQGSGVRYSSDPEVGGIEIDADAPSGDLYERFSITNNRFVVSASEIAKVADGEITVGNGVIVNRVHNRADGITGKLTLDSGAYAATLKDVTATSGDIEFHYMSATDQANLDTLEIGAGKTVSMYTGSVAEAAQEASVTVSGTLKAGEGATLNANLVMEAGSTLDVSGTGGAGLAMGSTVTLNRGVTLSDGDMAAITDLGFMDQYTLFTGVDAFFYNGTTPTSTPIAFDSETWVKASEVFSNSEFTGGKDYYVFYSGAQNGSNVGAVYVMQLPEPTTGTLSLLALAALAARRRRK